MYAEIVFRNGVIWTADRLHPLAQAIAVTGEEIIFAEAMQTPVPIPVRKRRSMT